MMLAAAARLQGAALLCSAEDFNLGLLGRGRPALLRCSAATQR